MCSGSFLNICPFVIANVHVRRKIREKIRGGNGSLICQETDKQEDTEGTAKLFRKSYNSEAKSCRSRDFYAGWPTIFPVSLILLFYIARECRIFALKKEKSDSNMNIKRFIDRPLLSIVINVMVVAVGIIALTRLPIEKFPDIAPPTVYLWASYPARSDLQSDRIEYKHLQCDFVNCKS